MQLLERLATIVGPEQVLTGAQVSSRAVSWADHGPCRALAIVRPGSTDEVSRVLAACHAAGQPVVTLGGLTGLVRGCVAEPHEIGLTLERMHRIESIDVVGRTMTVEAGVPLQRVQEAAGAHGLLYPVDFGARGSAHIGGSVATNAGGNGVIRYGMTRESVLGLEAVLADGTVIPAMNRMLKNNAAYDVKQLFIGTEGTLGVVTRLVLRLREMPRSTQTAMVACPGFAEVTGFLKHMDAALGGALSAFELMWKEFYLLVTTPPAKGSAPLSRDYDYYVLVESEGGDPARDQSQFEEAIGAAMETGLVSDAVIAGSEAQREALWALRDDVESFFRLGMPVVFDVSLPVAEMQEYVAEVLARLEREWPAYRRFVFGHLGDGNLHVIAAGPPSQEARHGIERCVYEPLAARHGSVSAEHGIGLEKQPWLAQCRSPAELELMQKLKDTLDPKGILNRGRVLAN
ncbi:MAG TPA: FAD-binding oxidoreductase [Steroidobacteraceae bacterium]|nr:FAD-binding oxidoreductase [Steroidobacteraceae bacterium]